MRVPFIVKEIGNYNPPPRDVSNNSRSHRTQKVCLCIQYLVLKILERCQSSLLYQSTELLYTANPLQCRRIVWETLPDCKIYRLLRPVCYAAQEWNWYGAKIILTFIYDVCACVNMYL